MIIMLTLVLNVALASEAHEVATFASPALEALVAPFEEASVLPGLGNCPPKVRRVHATDLDASQVLENAINGYVSDLETDRDRAYEFGLLATTPRSPERVRASWLELATEPTPGLGALADVVWNALARAPQLSFKSGTAVYSKRPDHEDELRLRVVTDATTDEFLLLAVGTCN